MARGVKMCLMEEIGFEEPCAETCVGHYGLWNVLTNDMGDALTDEDGNLNPCLACDEYRSGPGFQYAAGRTRRSSGLESAIDRAETEIYPIDHRRYFE